MAREPRALNPKFKTPATPKAGAMRSAVDPVDSSMPDDQDEQRRTVLAATISNRLREMMDARQSSGIEEIWQQSEDLYNGLDPHSGDGIVKVRGNAVRATGMANGRARVILNITKPKTDIGVARVAEMLIPTDDKPWAIEPTPIPELDQEKLADPAGQVTLADGSTTSAAALAMKVTTEAQEKAEAMTKWVEDGFVECDAYTHMRKQIRHAGRIGTGVLKGPFPMAQKNRTWKQDESGATVLAVESKIVPASKTVRVQDCFWDESCGESIHDGSDFAERDFITGKALRALAELPGYDAMSIAMALAEGPQVVTKTRNTAKSRQQAGDSMNDSKLYEVFYYFGDVQPSDMILMGMEKEMRGEDGELVAGTEGGLTDLEMQLYTVPCIVTMLNGRPIKCDINPMEKAGFPYDFFVWDQIEGQPCGRGIPYKMAVAQRMLTAAVRQLLENAGLSAGPIVAYMNGVMTPENGVYELKGRTLWRFEPNEFTTDINKALAVFSIPSMQEELSKIIEFSLQMADQLTNMPMLMQGDQQAGTSPETLGGMKMLMNNAMSPLRNLAKQHDDMTTKPHLKRWVDWGMEKGPDNIKGDHQVVARGSTALIQREEGAEFLQMLFPVLANPDFRIDPEKYTQELARARGYNMKLIQYSDDDWKKKQEEDAKKPPPPIPAIEAAKIRAASAEKIGMAGLQQKRAAGATAEQARAVHEENDRALRVQELRLREVERQDMLDIAITTLSTTKGISIDEIKADLAKAAMNNRLEVADMQLKLNPANKTGTGIAGGVGDNTK